MFVSLHSSFNFSSNVLLVKRVHWLRARALKDRWHEEHILVTYEMQWTVRYFLYKETMWQVAGLTPTSSPGATAYAVRQGNMWKKLAHMADKVFKSLPSQYVSPVHIM
jgi:hypothetical protein